jgi:hypothetical protein
VGKGHGDRYINLSSRNQQCLDVVKKYGFKNIIKEILEHDLTEQEAFDKEQYYIALYENTQPLTNKNKGGLGSGDWFERATDEEKTRHREISKSFLGKKHSEETKKKISESHLKLHRHLTDEQKKRLSEVANNRKGYWRGKHLSEETKHKLSVAAQDRVSPQRKPVYVLNNELEIIQTAESRAQTFVIYNQLKEHDIRRSLEQNNKITDLSDLVYSNGLAFIYKKIYDLLIPQSTIETVSSD